MAENTHRHRAHMRLFQASNSPESLSKKWFLLASLGAVLYFSVVFGYVIFGNDALLDQPQTGGETQHD